MLTGCTVIDSLDLAGVGSAPDPLTPSPPASRSAPRYQSHPTWGGTRRFESAETTRLNSAHWLYADDQSVNVWLTSQLAEIRSRSTYEARQNGTILGVINSYADDVVGPNGPTLQVLSDDEDYNDALERVWRDWFAAPTTRSNISGVSWLKVIIRSLWKSGEYLGVLVTDPWAEGPVQLRIRPLNARRLATPQDLTGDPNVLMGIRFDELGRPTQYYIDQGRSGGLYRSSLDNYQPYPPDLVIHEFILEEEDQARGIPWLNTALTPAAELRDYDDQVMDAARQAADQSLMLFTRSVDVPAWQAPESMTVQRRTWKMAPPQWEPFASSPNQPPVQYPDFRAERQREIGRPKGIPLLMVRLDASKHNYSSARLDTQGYDRTIQCDQQWISGSEQSVGTLNRLLDLVGAEARFSVPALRNRPAKVSYVWTWPRRPHVDPSREATGEAIGLQNLTVAWSDALAARGTTAEQQIAKISRELRMLREAGLPVPAEWIKHPSTILMETAETEEPAETVDE